MLLLEGEESNTSGGKSQTSNDGNVVVAALLLVKGEVSTLGSETSDASISSMAEVVTGLVVVVAVIISTIEWVLIILLGGMAVGGTTVFKSNDGW